MATEEVISRLERIEHFLTEVKVTLSQLITKQVPKSFYTIEEFSVLVGRAPFTCREWARLSRIRATKRHSGRGSYLEWVVPYEEYLRYLKDGLLAIPTSRNGNQSAKPKS